MDSRTVIQKLFRKCALPICVVPAAVLIAAATSAAQEPPRQATTPGSVLQHQIHAAYLLGGQTIGSYGERSNTLATGEIQTVIDSDLIFNRLGNKVEIKSTSQYEETAEGQLESAAAAVSSSQQATHIEASVGSHSLHITTTAGGRSYERTVALSGALLGPEAARRLVLSHHPARGETITYDAFYPEFGVVATVTDTVIGTEEVSTDRGSVPGLKIEQTMSAMPGKITLWLDSEGWLLRQMVPGPFGDVEARRSNAPVSTNRSKAQHFRGDFLSVHHQGQHSPAGREVRRIRTAQNHTKAAGTRMARPGNRKPARNRKDSRLRDPGSASPNPKVRRSCPA